METETRDPDPVLDAAQDALATLTHRHRPADVLTFRAAAPGYLMVALDAETVVVLTGLLILGAACMALAILFAVLMHLPVPA